MERTWLTFHCWLYTLCIVVYVANKTWNLKCNVEKKTIDTITKFVMVLLVIMGLVLVLMETVMDPVGLYW